MAITFEMKVEDDVLFVTARGRDESTEEVLEYGKSLIEKAAEAGVTHVLCDERQLEYALDTMQIFESARQIANMASRVAKVAIVCNPEDVEDGLFWETVAVNRGLLVSMGTDMDRAKAWLLNHNG
jgi:hypothetical protein